MMADAPAVVKYFLRKLSGCKGLTGGLIVENLDVAYGQE